MANYKITDNGWLIYNNHSTKFFNKKDLEWLNASGEPRLNSDGFMVMPFGNTYGKELYPELHNA